MAGISPTTRRRFDIQGLESVDHQALSEAAPWLRLSFGLCTALAITGTLLASPLILWLLLPIAALGAALPVHPFDHLYNHTLRHVTKTRPLPRRGAPSRFACGLGSVWLVATAIAFQSGAATLGYFLGGSLSFVGLLVSTTDICIPSLIYRSIFGFPPKRKDDELSQAKGSVECLTTDCALSD